MLLKSALMCSMPSSISVLFRQCSVKSQCPRRQVEPSDAIRSIKTHKWSENRPPHLNMQVRCSWPSTLLRLQQEVSHTFLSPSEAGRDYWERILITSTLNTSLSSGSTQAFPAFGNVWGRETSATSTWSRWRSNLIQSKSNAIHMIKVKIKCDSMLKSLKFILLPLN